MYKIVCSLSRAAAETAPLYFTRCSMASGRNIYIKGGSNKQDIPSETKKLIATARDPDDMRWQLGHGIQEPLEVDLTTEEKMRATQYKIKYKGHRVMEGEDKVKYYPHKDELIPDEPPSPVLMVEKAQTDYGQPYWIKDYLIQIGKLCVHSSGQNYCLFRRFNKRQEGWPQSLPPQHSISWNDPLQN